MISYCKPQITRIKLDPQQAVLAACVVGGVYMSTVGTNNHCVPSGTGGGLGMACWYTPKGITAGRTIAAPYIAQAAGS